jgi:outer membrane receptor for ferrienterochelin and colicins
MLRTFFFKLALLIHLTPIALFAQDSATARVLDEVVVTGQFAPQSVKNSVYRVRVIKKEQIQMRGATDVAGVLNNELGIRFNTDYTLGETDITIMGMSGQNVKVLLDGIPLVDRGGTKQSLSHIDINSIERIEMVEGPMSVVYGTDALAGVINIITKKNNHSPFSITAKVQEESVAGMYSPFAKEGVHNEHLGVQFNKNAWGFLAYGTRNSFDGWTGNAAYRAKEWKPKDQWLTGASMQFRKQDYSLQYRLDYLNEDIHVPGALNPNNYRAKDQDYITDRFTHQAQFDWRVSHALRLSAAASYQDYKRKTETYIKDLIENTSTPTIDAGEWDVSTFKSIFFRSTAQWTFSPKISFQPGIEIKSDRTSGQRIEGEPVINDYSVFLSMEIRPDAFFNIRPGIRFSKNSVYSAPPLIPSVNTKFSINENLDLRLSYARGFRAPSLRELYFYFFDASHSIRGNPDLEAEYSNSFVAATTWQPAGLKKVQFSATASAFHNHFHNRIGLALGANNEYTYVNIEEFKTMGATIENRMSYKNLTATLGLSYIGRYNMYYENPDFKDEDLSEFTWSPELNSNIIYRFPKWKMQAGLFYKLTGASPAYQVAVDESTNQEVIYLAKTESWHLADVTLSKNIFNHLTIQAGIKNLFNVTRLQNTASGDSIHTGGGTVLTSYGRSYFIGLNYQWSN